MKKLIKIIVFRLTKDILAFIKQHPRLQSWLSRQVHKRLLLRWVTSKLIGINQYYSTSFGQSTVTAQRIYHYGQTGLVARASLQANKQKRHKDRLKLAFVCPMPPQYTGIANSGSQLLIELAQYYDITVITPQTEFSGDWQKHIDGIQTPTWLRENFYQMDRVLYHLGNNRIHDYALELISSVPGVVVLHDFFLSGLYSECEYHGDGSQIWTQELYHAHGYHAVKARFNKQEERQVRIDYPVNLSVLQNAVGVISHSQFSQNLAMRWYGEELCRYWKVAPLWRMLGPDPLSARHNARQSLKIPANDFIVCSFGFLAFTKLSDRLIHAWAASKLAKNEHARLMFVGKQDGGEYGKKIIALIEQYHLQDRVIITDWLDIETYRAYLSAADLGVQLRAFSRGESSGTVLECMAFGLPVIANAHGAFAELPAHIVSLLPDNFTNEQLIEALEQAYFDKSQREARGRQGRSYVRENCTPAIAAAHYRKAIEHFQTVAHAHPGVLIQRRAQTTTQQRTLFNAADSIAKRIPFRRSSRQLLLDISATHQYDLKTGIERITRGLCIGFLLAELQGWRVEPVYLTRENGRWYYRYARHYTLNLLNCPSACFQDDVVEIYKGDILLILDKNEKRLIDSIKSGLHARWQKCGVKIYTVVHDLLSIFLPEVFPPITKGDTRLLWLKAITQLDGALCVSKSVAMDLSAWLERNHFRPKKDYLISWFHHGADIENSGPTTGLSENAPAIFQKMAERPTFLMVGTIEPRKGYQQALAAFSLLWEQGVDINLVIVGHEGWKSFPETSRRNIPQTVHLLRHHAEVGCRLFWLEGISDEYLQKVYTAASVLLTTSLGEGFGLPVVEAARYQLPIIARDLPIFREVTAGHAYFFSGEDAESLARDIQNWLSLYRTDVHPNTKKMPWSTFKKSAESIMEQLIK